MPTIALTTPIPVRTPTGGGRKPRVNDFIAVIDQFNDGAARTIVPAAGEKLSVLLGQLRDAATSIDRSVKIQWLDNAGLVAEQKGASHFKFELRPKISRPRATRDIHDIRCVEVAEEVVTAVKNHKGTK